MLQEIGINYLSQVVEFFVYVGFFICFTNVKVEQKYQYCYKIHLYRLYYL